MNNHSQYNSLSQKRYFDASYLTTTQDFEPTVKKQFKSDLTSLSKTNILQEPIIIDDSDIPSVEPLAYGKTSNLDNLLQLSLFSAYLEQVKQVREVERRYSDLFANFSQSLFRQDQKETDISTNDSEIDSSLDPSHQDSPNPIGSRNLSSFIDLESDEEEEIIFIEKPISTALENKPIEKVENKQENIEAKVEEDDEIEISSELLASIPRLERKSPKKTGRRQLKSVWTPSEQKVEHIERLITELEASLAVKISNQELVCKLYSENGCSVKETLKHVLSQRSTYRFVLKDKRAVVSVKTKSVKL